MFVSETFKRVMQLEMQIENCEAVTSEFSYKGNLEDANHYYKVIDRLKKELIKAKRVHKQSTETLVYSC